MLEIPPFAAYGLAGVLAVLLAPKMYTFFCAVAGGWNKDNIPARLKICKACPRVRERVTVDHDGNSHSYLYCDECKCGSHHLAELSYKLGFNNLRCPMDPPKWGKKEAMTVHEAHDVLTGRLRKEAAIDQAERANLMAGRPRDADPISANNVRRATQGTLAEPNPKGRGAAAGRGDRLAGRHQTPDGPVTRGSAFTNAPDQIPDALAERSFRKRGVTQQKHQANRTAQALELKRQSEELQQQRASKVTPETKEPTTLQALELQRKSRELQQLAEESVTLTGVDHADGMRGDDMHVDQG